MQLTKKWSFKAGVSVKCGPVVPWAVIEVDAKYSTGVIIPSER